MLFTFGNPQITNIVKTSIVSLIIGLLMISTLSGQVKIGNNPQNLNPASVLELESTTRVLVITRVTDAQMNVINPLPGAVVYNTDQECLHYYNGTVWVNICEELDNSFTISTRADYLSQLNPQARDSTVVISQTNNPDGSINYNFEVGQITGANIVDTSINGSSKLQDDSVTRDKLADESVTLEKLADAITGQPGDIFQWNGSQWTLVNESVLGITEKDSIVGNEVFDATLNGSLVRNGAGTEADPFTLDVTDGGIGTLELADDAVTTLKISDGNVTNAKLDKTNIPLSGFGAAGADIDLGANKIANLLDPTNPQDAATKNYVDTEITNNAADGTETGVTGAGINVVTGDGSTATPYVITATEAQDLTDVLTLDPSAGNNTITDVADPTNPQDAATKNYVDTEITNNAADGTETGVTGAGINVVTGDGSTATPYVITATEAQDLTDVLTLDPSAGNNTITDVADPTNPQDAATKNYVDTEITNNAADGTETGVTGAGINVVTGDGSTATPYVITATEAQDLTDVLTLDPSAGNNTITDVADPTNPQDAATKNYVDTEITNNAADGTETGVTGAGINVVTGDGSTATPYVITATEAQDLTDVLTLDPSAGNNTITDVADPTNPQDAATKNYVDTEITNNAADGTETGVTGAGINVVTGDGSTATPYVITATEAQDLTDVLTLDPSAGNNTITDVADPTNPQDAATKNYVDTEITNNAADGTETGVTGAGINVVTGDGSTATPYVITATEAQDLTDVLTLDPSAGNNTITDVADPTNPQDAATKNYVDTVTDEIANAVQVLAADGTSGLYNIADGTVDSNSIIQLTVQENTSGNPIMIQLVSQAIGNFSVQIYEFVSPGFTPTANNANWQYIVVNP